jgi:hypothetical protein
MPSHAFSPTSVRRRCDQRGIALITTLLVIALLSALMVGFMAAVMADHRAAGLERDQTQAYAAAHAGLEKLTSDLSGLFTVDFSPSAAQVSALTTTPPTLPGFTFTDPATGGSGYQITFIADGSGNPAPENTNGSTISAGPYQGFRGIITPYDITVTARSTGGAEVRMRRTLQTVAIPVFQFGIFSENDLSFFAGPDFNFGGRVHTNANLFLAEGNGATLTLSDRVTTVGEVIRTNLSNGWNTNTNYTGNVRIIRAPSSFRNLARTEGSLVGTVGSAQNNSWENISKNSYNSYIVNWLTGARRLDLPLVSQGATPVDLIRRPAQNSNEHTASPLVYRQRFFSQASLRILLSDTAADITNLPTVTATAPVPLDGTATAAQYGPVDATHPPIATSPGPNDMATTTGGVTNAGAVTINMSLIPTQLRPRVVRVNGLPAAGVLCTGRTPTAFTGCPAGLPAAPTGSVVSSTIQWGTTSVAVSTTLTNPIAVNANTMNVVSTAAFANATFWVNLANAAPLFVTCTGNTAAAFTGCTGVTSNIPNNTPISNNALSPLGTPLVNGFIKIERQANGAAGTWTDVTTEILNLGIAARNQAGTICADPNPNAVIRLQRLRDNVTGCTYPSSQNSNDYWPLALYDTREGNLRDSLATTSANITPAGIMHYVELDVNNLRRWLAGTIGATGTQARNDNGFIVYFSDRRNNRNAVNQETGELGFEDVVNPADVNGAPNNVLDAGENVNAVDGLDIYGRTPQNVPAGAALPFTNAALPFSTTVGGVAINAAHAMVNRPIFFRRALKLVNGALGNLPVGFTVASENPVYVQGNYNALANNTLADPHIPAAVIADAVTLLSNSWNDVTSFRQPNNPAGRNATTTGYRMAIIGGKGLSFPQPTAWAADQDFGTDGGAHNFLRYVEDWSNETLNYRGSIVSFYTSRQAVGTYKCCTNVYSPPSRGYNFDTDFLVPALLPPGTPMFRDVNTLTFRQLLRPTQ